MKKVFVLVVLCLVFAFTACGHKAETVDNVIKAGKDAASIEHSIILAARSLGWVVKPLDNQTMEATIKSSERALTVLITYTPDSYIIAYKDSLNLDFDPENNSINKQYNRWVEDLSDRIDEEMKRAAKHKK